jgi:hypothetical protein
MDRWMVHRLGPLLRSVADPLVIDLGYGATAVTTVELATRLRQMQPGVRVLGLELDPERVTAAAAAAEPPALVFARGGFELAGHRPHLVRAANVLRQYDEASAAHAWVTLRNGLAGGGVIVEGTCDEIGRRGAWVLLDAAGPISLTLAAHPPTLGTPSDLAARLPKALIHHNVVGQPIRALLRDLDRAWAAHAGLSTFGPRQRWVATCASAAAGWPVLDRSTRWRHGELTVAWSAVAPL